MVTKIKRGENSAMGSETVRETNHLAGKESLSPTDTSVTKLESWQMCFTWRGKLYCMESGDMIQNDKKR